MTATCVIFGAQGQMGMACARAFQSLDLHVVALSRQACDITKPTDLERVFDMHKPDFVLNGAAFTAVDACETQEELAQNINGVGAALIGQQCASYGAILMHLSTDYVFGDGLSAPLVESAPAHPINAYGRSKRAGELAIIAACPQHIILRTSWVFGPHSQNFFKTMVRLGGQLSHIPVVADEAACPTFAGDLAVAIGQIITHCQFNTPKFGIWHACGSEGVSRLEFAGAIMAARRAVGLSAAELTPTSQQAFGAPARRPFDSRLDCSALAGEFGIVIPSFRQQLDANVQAVLDQQKESH